MAPGKRDSRETGACIFLRCEKMHAPVPGRFPADFAGFAVTDPPQGDTLQVVIRRKRRPFMAARGRVQNGVVVLADGVRLPEGQEVTVLAPAPAGSPTHGILDIPPVSLGAVVRPFTADDDLLGEMLEGRA